MCSVSLYLINLLLQLLNFIIEFINIVEQRKILVLYFNELGYQQINIFNTSGFLDCLESCLVWLKCNNTSNNTTSFDNFHTNYKE